MVRNKEGTGVLYAIQMCPGLNTGCDSVPSSQASQEAATEPRRLRGASSGSTAGAPVYLNLSSKSSPWLGKSPYSQSLREHTHLNCFFQFYKWPLKLSSWEVFAPIHHLLRVWSHRFFFSDSTWNSLPPGVGKGAGKGQPPG